MHQKILKLGQFIQDPHNKDPKTNYQFQNINLFILSFTISVGRDSFKQYVQEHHKHNNFSKPYQDFETVTVFLYPYLYPQVYLWGSYRGPAKKTKKMTTFHQQQLEHFAQQFQPFTQCSTAFPSTVSLYLSSAFFVSDSNSSSQLCSVRTTTEHGRQTPWTHLSGQIRVTRKYL